jgi:hypothetical protein
LRTWIWIPIRIKSNAVSKQCPEKFEAVMRIRDPVPFQPLDPGSGWAKIRIWDEQPGSYHPDFWVKKLKFFDANPGWEKIRIRDP